MIPELKEIPFPLAGLDETARYYSQPPYTSPAALNVRTIGSGSGRRQGGSRPGLAKYFSQQLPAQPTLLATAEIVPDSGYRVWSETFNGETLGRAWGQGWQALPLPEIDQTDLEAVGPASTEVGGLREHVAFRDPVHVELSLRIRSGADCNGDYYVYFDVPRSSPTVRAAGKWVKFDITGDGANCSLTLADSSGTIDGPHAVTLSAPVPEILELTVTITSPYGAVVFPNARVQGYYNGKYSFGYALGVKTLSASPTLHGFSVVADASNEARLIGWRTKWAETGGGTDKTIVIAGANGTLYSNRVASGTLAAIASSGSAVLSVNTRQRAADRLGHLFISDHDVAPVDEGWGNLILDASYRWQLDSPNHANWGALGVSAVNHMVEIEQSQGAQIQGAYRIDSVGTSYLTLGDIPITPLRTGANSEFPVYFRVWRVPKFYNVHADRMEPWAAKVGLGSVPLGQRSVFRYRDRMVMFGRDSGVYMSRSGDPFDWDYGADPDDASRAVFFAAAEAGGTGERIVGGAPFSDDYCLFWTSNTAWILRGDPAAGGQLDQIADSSGIVWPDAWCKDPDGAIYWLSRNGVMRFDGQSARVFSALRIPRKLLSVDGATARVSMAYDRRDQGIHLYVTDVGGGAPDHYWIDVSAQAFWPVSFPDSGFNPLFAAAYVGVASGSDVLLACSDGYIRRYGDGATQDDGVSFESYVDLGPYLLGSSPGRHGKLMAITAALAGFTQSAGVTYEIRAADSPEEAANAAVDYDGSWLTAGRNPLSWPKLLGEAAIIRVKGVPGARWGLESVSVAAMDSGPLRKRV